MGSIGRDLNRILVTMMMIFEDHGRHLSLLQEALARATAKIDHSGYARAHANLHHVQHVLNHVELKVVFLFKASGGNPDRNATIGNRRTENWYAGLVRRRQDTVFGGNLGKLAAEEMEKLTRRIRTC